MGKIIYGRDLDNLHESWIEKAIENWSYFPHKQNYYLITSDKRKADSIKKKILNKKNEIRLNYLDIFNNFIIKRFEHLIINSSDNISLNTDNLDWLYLDYFIENNINQRDDFYYLKRIFDYPNFAIKIQKQIQNIKKSFSSFNSDNSEFSIQSIIDNFQNNVNDKSSNNEIDSLIDKLKELEKLSIELNKLKSKNNIIDYSNLYSYLIKAYKENPIYIGLPKDTTINLIGFTNLDINNLLFLKQLNDYDININISFYYDDTKKDFNPEAVYIISKAKELGFEIEKCESSTKNKFCFLTEHLYNENENKNNGNKENENNSLKTNELTDYITIKSEFNIANEIDFIVSDIKNKIINDKLTYNDFAIVCNNISIYKSQFESSFSKYKLPFYTSDGKRFLENKMIKTLLNVIKLKINNFPYESFVELLSSPYIFLRYPDEDNTNYKNTRILLKELKNIFRDSNYISKDFIKQLKNIINRKLENDNYKNKKELVELHQAVILYIESSKDIIDKHLPLKTKLKTYIKLLNELIVEYLSIVYNIYKADDHKVLRDDSIVIEKFFNLTQNLVYTHELISDDEIKLKDFYNILYKLLDSNDYHTDIQTDNKIQIISPNMIIGEQYKNVYYCGMIEKVHPKSPPYSVYFNDNDIKHLKKHDVYMKNKADFYNEQTGIFLQSLLSATENICFTYPVNENHSREYLKSFYLNDIESLLNYSESNNDNDKDNNNDKYLNIYSETDLYNYICDDNINIENLKDIESKSNTDILIHKYNTLKQNIESDNQSIYKGYLSKSVNIDILKNIIKNKYDHISVSEIEEYAQCPLKHFFNKIIDISIDKEKNSELDISEKGLFIHKVLEIFYNDVVIKNREKILNKELDIYNEKYLDEKLKEILIQQYKEITEKRYIPKLIDEIENLKINYHFKIIKAFINNDKNYWNETFPYCTEWKFGKDKDNYLKFDIDEENFVKIYGRIDRLDSNIENDNTTTIKIIDYKTGEPKKSKKTCDDIKNGILFQPSIYTLKIQQEIKPQNKQWNYKYVSYKAIKEDIFSLELQDDELFLDQSIEHLREILKRIFSLDFRISDESKNCEYCNYKSICRHK